MQSVSSGPLHRILTESPRLRPNSHSRRGPACYIIGRPKQPSARLLGAQIQMVRGSICCEPYSSSRCFCC